MCVFAKSQIINNIPVLTIAGKTAIGTNKHLLSNDNAIIGRYTNACLYIQILGFKL